MLWRQLQSEISIRELRVQSLNLLQWSCYM